MARPRRSEHTKERLIEQGIELLSENGYHGTGIKQILDAVNVPKGSFYNYFDSKEKFAAEIISIYSRDLIAEFDAFVESSEVDPLTKIKTVYHIMIDRLEEQGCEKGCLIGNMAAEIGGTSAVCQQSLQETVGRWRRRFVQLIELGQQQGQFRQDMSAEQLADIFWNVWEGGILRMKIEGKGERLRQSVDTTLETLFK